MSSPFSKAFNAKSPVTPLQGNAFIKAKMDAEAAGKKSFVVDGKSHPVQMEGSPYHKHGKLEKKLKKAEAGKIGAEQGDKDYELIASIKKDIKEAKAAHNNDRTESDDAQAREDEDAARGSAAEMSAIKKKSAPLNASYANPQDYFYVSNRDDFQKLFDNISSNTAKVIDARNDPEKEADRLQRRVDRMSDRKKTPGRDKRIKNVEAKIKDAKDRITNTSSELEECLKAGGTYANGKCT